MSESLRSTLKKWALLIGYSSGLLRFEIPVVHKCCVLGAISPDWVPRLLRSKDFGAFVEYHRRYKQSMERWWDLLAPKEYEPGWEELIRDLGGIPDNQAGRNRISCTLVQIDNLIESGKLGMIV